MRQAKFNQTLAIFRAARVGSIICGFGVNEAILAKNDNDGNLSGTFSRRHGPGLQAARHDAAIPENAASTMFGRNDSYWCHLTTSLGRHDIVGTTLKQPQNLPAHFPADEKHARFHGDKAYIAATVAHDCVFGASISLTADTEGLTEAYGHFKFLHAFIKIRSCGKRLGATFFSRIAYQVMGIAAQLPAVLPASEST